jgi:WXG100 family type VII secretion target
MSGAVLTDGSNKSVIKVNFSDLDAMAGRMVDRAQQIYDELDAINDELAKLGSDWSDANSKRYSTYFINSWSAYVTQAGYLKSYSETLKEVKHLYEGLQDEIDALLAGLGS